MKSWFEIETALIDRIDLSAYEKLCCVVIARYAGRPEFDHLLTIDTLARKMGVDSRTAEMAFRGLFEKGLLQEETGEKNVDIVNNSEEGKLDETSKSKKSRLIKLVDQRKDKLEKQFSVEPLFMPDWDEEKKERNPVKRQEGQSREEALEAVMKLIEEPINARQGRIILGLARWDVSKISACYENLGDVASEKRIDALIEKLQDRSEKPSKKEKEISKKTAPIGRQVNQFRLAQMKKYKNIQNEKNFTKE